MYLVKRLETTCTKSLIPFHAVWGPCWYNIRFCLKTQSCTSSARVHLVRFVASQIITSPPKGNQPHLGVNHVRCLLAGLATCLLGCILSSEHAKLEALRFVAFQITTSPPQVCQPHQVSNKQTNKQTNKLTNKQANKQTNKLTN